MSFARVLSSLAQTRVVKAVSGFGTREPPRIDTDLPFRARIGGLVKIEPTFFMLCEAEFPGLSISYSEDYQFIQWYGVIKDAGFTIHRFYLTESQVTLEPSFVLQVVTDASGNVIERETTLWYAVHNEYPDLPDDWLTWVDTRQGVSGIIGYPVFDDVTAGSPPPRYWLARDFASQFRNDAHPQDPSLSTERIAMPRLFRERVHSDKFGSKTADLERQGMLYFRVPPRYSEGKCPHEAPMELVFISTVTASGGAWVEIRKGFRLSSTDFTVV